MLFDRRYPSFRNFDSTIALDVVRMKSYMDSLFDPTCVPVRVTINKINFFSNRKDVESLFTNVPIEGAVKDAICKLENDPGLADRTNLTPTQIASLGYSEQ